MRFDATKLAELVDEESRLRNQQREISTHLNEMQASDTPWDDVRTAEYHRLTADHGRIALDLQAVSSARRDYELREPRRSAVAQAGPLARFLRKGCNGLEESEIKLHCEVSDEAAGEAQMSMGGPVEGFALKMTPLHQSGVPGALRPRAQTRSDDATGQELVQETVPPRVIDRLAYYGGIARMAQSFMTATGNEYRMPTEDNASQEGEILGSQDTTVAGQDLSSFVATVFNAKTGSSKSISLTREMLQDAVFDIQMYAERVAVRRLGRIWDKVMTTNAVGGEPQGVRNCMIVGTGAGNTEQVTATADVTVWDDLVNLIYKVNRAYRVGGEMGEGGFAAEGGGRIGWLFSDEMERGARLFKDADNRPLWIPSVRDGVPNMFAGYPYEVSGPMSTNGVPTVTDDIPALFGNFSYFAIRNVQSIEIFRFMDSRTMQNNLVECLAFSRRDAKVIGAVNGGTGRSQTTEAIGRLKVA